MGLREDLLGQARRLGSFAHVPEWDARHKTGHAVALEDPGRRLVLRVRVDGLRKDWDVGLYRYERRPEGADGIQAVAGRGEAQGGPLHGGRFEDAEDLRRRLGAVFDQLAQHLDTFAWGSPHWRASYDERYRSPQADRDRFVAELPALALSAIALLEPERDEHGQQRRFPAGFVFAKRKHPAYASSWGLVPERLELLVWQQPGPPADASRDWVIVDSLLSPAEQDRLVSSFFEDGAAALLATGRWEMACEDGTGGPSLVLERGPRVVPEPSLIAWLHASPRYAGFRSFLDSVPADALPGVYLATAPQTDARTLLEARVTAAPADLSGYLELAKAHRAAGDEARAQLWTALGYLRAKKLTGLAEAKLRAAREIDPDLPGLRAALDELERVRGPAADG